MRGFNLLLVLAGLLVGTLIVNWRQTRQAVRRVRVSRHGQTGGFAGETIPIRYELRNTSRFQSLWSMRIDDPAVEAKAASDGGLSTLPLDGIPILTSIGHVTPGQVASVIAQVRFRLRGRYALGPLTVSTTFPFSLIKCGQTDLQSSSHRYIYPAPIATHRGWQRLLPPRQGGDGRRSTGATHHDGEFFGLRPWRSGDQIKQIHWRTTARLNDPAVRQFEQRNQYKLCVIVDAVAPEFSAGQPDAKSVDDFETLLRLACTLIDKLAAPTHPIALLIAGAGDQDTLVRQASGGQPNELFEKLAVAQLAAVDSATATSAVGSGGSRTGNARIRGAFCVEDPLLQAIASQSRLLHSYDWVVVSARKLRDVCNRNFSEQGYSEQGYSEQENAAIRSGRDRLSQFHRQGRVSWLDIHSQSTRQFFRLPVDEIDQGPSLDVDPQAPTEATL